MEQIKNYFKEWGISRIVKMTLGISLFIAYYYNRETFFLFVGAMLTLQAVFNMSCPGGSCNTATDKDSKTIVNVKKYEPEK